VGTVERGLICQYRCL